MTTRNIAATLRVDADISAALSGLQRLQQRANRVAGGIDRATGGAASGAAGVGRAAGRGGIGVGQIIGAGAGLQAGFAVFEQLFERLFELFEETDILTAFTDAMDTVLRAFAPLAGVIIQAVTPAIRALEPALVALLPVLTPLIEIFGQTLLFAVQALTPVIQLLARILTPVIRGIQGVVNWFTRLIVNVLNRIPGINIDLGQAATGTLDRSQRQLADATARRAAEEAAQRIDRQAQQVQPPAPRETPVQERLERTIIQRPPTVRIDDAAADRIGSALSPNITVQAPPITLGGGDDLAVNLGRAIELLNQTLNRPYGEVPIPAPGFPDPREVPIPAPSFPDPIPREIPAPTFPDPREFPVPFEPAGTPPPIEARITIPVHIDSQVVATAIRRETITTREFGGV